MYAPGIKGYKSVSRVIDSLPELELKPAVYPKAEVLYMPTIKERVPVFQGTFRIRQEVKVSSMAEFRNSLGTDGYVHPSSKIRFVTGLREILVFVGGAVTSLLVTDEGAGLPRTTLDVDAIAEISSYAEYTAFGERLRALGFSEDASEGAPLCRWVHSGTILDVMPLDEDSGIL